MFELFPLFKGTIIIPYTVTSSCNLISRHDHVPIVSALTFGPLSLLTPTSFCVFLYSTYANARYLLHQHKLEADVYNLISSHPDYLNPRNGII